MPPPPNQKDELPGRLQGRYLSNTHDAGPINFIGRFGLNLSL
jgi:hypothetical protein